MDVDSPNGNTVQDDVSVGGEVDAGTGLSSVASAIGDESDPGEEMGIFAAEQQQQSCLKQDLVEDPAPPPAPAPLHDESLSDDDVPVIISEYIVISSDSDEEDSEKKNQKEDGEKKLRSPGGQSSPSTATPVSDGKNTPACQHPGEDEKHRQQAAEIDIYSKPPKFSEPPTKKMLPVEQEDLDRGMGVRSPAVGNGGEVEAAGDIKHNRTAAGASGLGSAAGGGAANSDDEDGQYLDWFFSSLGFPDSPQDRAGMFGRATMLAGQEKSVSADQLSYKDWEWWSWWGGVATVRDDAVDDSLDNREDVGTSVRESAVREPASRLPTSRPRRYFAWVSVPGQGKILADGVSRKVYNEDGEQVSPSSIPRRTREEAVLTDHGRSRRRRVDLAREEVSAGGTLSSK